MRDKASYLAAFRTRGLFRYSSVARIVRAAKACRRRRNLDTAGFRRRKGSFNTWEAEWRAAQVARRKYPEAKRARTDKVFRAAFLKRLRERKRTLLCPPARSCRAVSKWYGTRTKRNMEMGAIAEQQSIVFGRVVPPIIIPRRPAWVFLPGSDRYDMAEIAQRIGMKVVQRGKSWECSATLAPSSYIHTDGEYRKRGSAWRTVTRARNDTRVRLFAVIRTDRELECMAHERLSILTLPEGFRWDIDANGLRVVSTTSPQDDYHLSALDLICTNPDGLLVLLRINTERRLKMRAKEAAFRAEQEGVFVCLADSLRAGNCREGSISFAVRHSIDPGKHYAALTLLEMANGDAGRVRLAITAASMRHKREMERGFAKLEEHQCPT